MNIYIGNLPYSMSDDDLEGLFTPYGTVGRTKVIMDKISGRSKGFGFIEMASDSEAEQAIGAINGKEVGGRELKVNEARPREDHPRR